MSLQFTDLVSDSLRNHTQKMRDSEDNETITFFIEDYEGEVYINRYYSIEGEWITQKNSILINSLGHSTTAKQYIRSIFEKLDKIIDLDFTEKLNNIGSQIDIYAISSSSGFEENTVGQIIKQETIDGGWYDLFWKKEDNYRELNSLEKSTIIHELGHSFGLSHPKDDPYNIEWDTEDTIMSYNKAKDSWSEWFSEVDIAALKSMWGRENDNGIMHFTDNSNNYEFKKVSKDKYIIETQIGIEDITKLETLKFSDQDFDVSRDIIGIFEQITGKDNITGKVFRLYNSAFNRIPDSDGFEYWIRMGNEGLNTYKEIGLSFLNSNEFKQKYSDDISNEDYLRNLYLNIFSRPPDALGYNYWLGKLENNLEDKVDILLGFSESIESKLLFTSQTML